MSWIANFGQVFELFDTVAREALVVVYESGVRYTIKRYENMKETTGKHQTPIPASYMSSMMECDEITRKYVR